MLEINFKCHHVALSVRDIQESITWYGQFGFEEKKRYDDPEGNFSISHLKLGEMFLELFWFKKQTPAPDSSHDLKTDLPRTGNKHFALVVDDIQETKAAFEKLGIAENIEIRTGKTDVTYFFIADPNGILLEFLEDKRGL